MTKELDENHQTAHTQLRMWAKDNGLGHLLYLLSLWNEQLCPSFLYFLCLSPQFGKFFSAFQFILG